MYSVIAQAILTPSNVLVPRPTSSKIMRLRSVALFVDVCRLIHFTMKVLCPRKFIRGAYLRKNSANRSNDRFFAVGIKLPICAMRIRSATWRMYVLFPCHIWPGDYHDRIPSSIQINIIGYKASPASLDPVRVTSVDYF